MKSSATDFSKKGQENTKVIQFIVRGGASNSVCTAVQKPAYDCCDRISYCIDANYYKGTTIENYFKKHRRQLVIETWDR